MKKVMVFGTFDILHPGHVNFFRQAKKLGDYLIVVVARDNTVRQLKKKGPLFDERQRLRHVRNIYHVNKVVLGNLTDKYAVIEKYRPDVIALGYDQKHFTPLLLSELKKRRINPGIVRLSPFMQRKYKSSKIRKSLEKARNLH